MIVKTDSAKYQIVFVKVPRVTNNGKQLIDTLCKVYKLEQEEVKFEPKMDWSEATAYQNPKDKYNKITGKKVALTYVLKLKPYLTKKERICFWNEFYQQFKRWR